MRPTLACVLALCALAAPEFSPPAAANAQADAGWEILSAPPGPQRPAMGVPHDRQKQKALAEWGQKLSQAREFQASYPGDPRNKGARKIELTALLKLQQISGRNPLTEDDASINNYIKDASVPAADRYDISALAKDVRADRSQIKSIDDSRALRARHARELITDFPDDARGYGYLLAVAKSLPAEQASEIAARLLESGAPARIKEGAAGLLAQKNMEGKKLQIDGLSLDAYAGQPVVIYTWSARNPDIFEFVKRRCVVPGVKIIGINIDAGTDAGAARRLAQEIQPPGDQYYDSGGMDGPIASQLRLQTAVSVYIIDAGGRLADTLGHENTVAKIKMLLAATGDAQQGAAAAKGGAL